MKEYKKIKVVIDIECSESVTEKRAMQIVMDRMKLFGEVGMKHHFIDTTIEIENYNVECINGKDKQ